VRAQYSDPGPDDMVRVAILGGSGKMGRWFAAQLTGDGKEVVISGRTEAKLLEAKRQLGVETASNVEAVKSADAVLFSVPIESFADVVREVGPHIRPGQIVVDITSIKVLPVDLMHRHIGQGTVLGGHSLFGPGARSLVNQNIILTPTSEPEAALAEKVRVYLENRGAKVSLMTPQEHDEMMTVILGLAHFIAIASADTLLSVGKLRQMAPIGGITYKVLLTLVESVISEDPELYASLQMNLPGLADMEKLFQRKARWWTDLVERKDRRQFIQRIGELRAELERNAPDFGRAYENMYRLVEWL